MQYLATTKDLGILLGPVKPKHALSVACDADWGGNDDAVSVSGVVALRFGAPLHWRSAKQQSVALSTAESELNALKEAAVLNQSLRMQLAELKMKPPEPTPVFSDNQAALAIVNGSRSSRAVRHVALAVAKVKEECLHNEMKPVPVRSADNLSDLFTKALPKARFVQLRAKLLSPYQGASRGGVLGVERVTKEVSA